jgi:hypothetical protein
MSDENLLNEMDLPLADSNDELAVLSETFFKPLFDEKKFIIRSEHERDKGIDFQIELKWEGKCTNFRFVVQLKATDSKDFNQDDSVSLQLNTGNINYLLNNPMPAFYVFYIKKRNIFYFENINDFAKSLYAKNPDWNSQPTHTIRFNKLFDSNGVEEMYQTTLTKGKFQRVLNEKTALKSSLVNIKDKILIDADLNITDDAEIRNLIEAVGFDLVNEGKWKEVIFVHKKASGNVASSAKYNLILGIANYYSGNLIDAFSFFRYASNNKEELTEDLVNYLQFFETIVKFSIGYFSIEDYNKKMEELEDTDNIGLYIKIDLAKKNYLESIDNMSDDKYERFVDEIQNVINDPKANDSIVLSAKCELILFEGNKNNMDYIKSISMINELEEKIGPNLLLRKDTVQRLILERGDWFKKVQAVKVEAGNSKNYFSFFHAIVNEVKVKYEFEVFSNSVFIVRDIPGIPKPEMPDTKPFFDNLLEMIENAIHYYNQIGHIENQISALSTKFEILHYLKNSDDANSVLYELENIIDSYDLRDQKRRLEILKNSGTTHEQLKTLMNTIFVNNERKNDKEEYEKMVSEMKEMDEAELEVKAKENSANSYIQLFPIGLFQFPSSERNSVYDILNITNEARKIFDSMSDNVIPIANIFYNPIPQEGYLDGNKADLGIANWRNIYRIRKAFFENKYYRFEMK